MPLAHDAAGRPLAGQPKPTQVTRLPLVPAKQWTKAAPIGLHVASRGISKATGRAVWDFFGKHPTTGEPGAFPWYQRFTRPGKYGHKNVWRSPILGLPEDGDQHRDQLPALHATIEEACAAMKTCLRTTIESTADPETRATYEGQLARFEAFAAAPTKSVNVHKHEPNWGLGAHYDDAHDPGQGMVLMVSVGNEAEAQPDRTKRQPRQFRFTDPIRGYVCDVPTWTRQVLMFTGDAYEQWRHESLRRPKQTGTCISMTIRLPSVCGYAGSKYGRRYAKGPREAEAVAHLRMRAILGLPDPN